MKFLFSLLLALATSFAVADISISVPGILATNTPVAPNLDAVLAAGNTSTNFIADGSGMASIDPNNRTVIALDGTTATFRWGLLDPYDTVTYRVDMPNGITDGTGKKALNPTDRQAFGSTIDYWNWLSIDWQAQTLNNWYQGFMNAMPSSPVSVDWKNCVLFGYLPNYGTATTSLDWQNRTLNAQDETVALKWNAVNLNVDEFGYAQFPKGIVDITDVGAQNPTGFLSIDPNNRALIASGTGTTSLDWQNRTLNAQDETVALKWNAVNLNVDEFGYAQFPKGIVDITDVGAQNPTGFLSIDPNNRALIASWTGIQNILWDTPPGCVTMQPVVGTIFNANGIVDTSYELSINPSGRTLNGDSGHISIDYSGKALLDWITDNPTLYWAKQNLGGTGLMGVAFPNGIMGGVSIPYLSVEPNLRQLVGADGATEMLDWSTLGTISFLGGKVAIVVDSGSATGTCLRVKASDNGQDMYIHVTSLGVITATSSR